MHILLILALTLHPATAKPVPSNRVVYSCPAGAELYMRVRGGALLLRSDGFVDLKGTDIVLIGKDAYYPLHGLNEEEAPQADDRHYCIAK